MFPSFWRRRVADVRLFVIYSTFSSALRAYNASPMNSTCGTTFPPGHSSLGYTPPRSSQIRSETHLPGARVASTPPPANPRNSQGPYMRVFFQMSIIYGPKSASHSPVVARSPANANMPHEIPGWGPRPNKERS